MAKKQKVTRKKLLKEPDEFITTTGRLIRWSRNYQMPLMYTAIAFFVILTAIAGLRYFSNQAENKAFTLLSQAVNTQEKLLNASGPEKTYEEMKDAYESLLRKYKNKQGAKIARLIYANLSLDAGNADQAILLYESALKDFERETSFTNFILSSLGYAYEKKHDYQQAITYFNTISSGDDPVMKDVALFNLGRLYGELGDESKSRDAYGRLVSDYADSIYFEIAKEKTAG
jgi:tetratricopeptide (TPR) repeat protein